MKKYYYDIETFKDVILINTETYKGNKLVSRDEDLLWDAKENKIFPISEYVRKKKVEDRKRKIQKIKDKL